MRVPHTIQVTAVRLKSSNGMDANAPNNDTQCCSHNLEMWKMLFYDERGSLEACAVRARVRNEMANWIFIYIVESCGVWIVKYRKIIFYLDHTIRYQLILFVAFQWNSNRIHFLQIFHPSAHRKLSYRQQIPNNSCALISLFIVRVGSLWPHLSRCESCWPSVKCAQVIVSNWLAAAKPTNILLSGISPTERCVNIFVFRNSISWEKIIWKNWEKWRQQRAKFTVMWIERNNVRFDWPQVLCSRIQLFSSSSHIFVQVYHRSSGFCMGFESKKRS